MSLKGNTVLERCERIVEIPSLIFEEGKKLAGLRAELRVQERKIEKREALLRKELMELGEYQACKNKEERDALYLHSKHSDLGLETFVERLEQLQALIDHSRNKKEALEHERKSLKAALEREYAEIIERTLQDKALANAVAGRWAA